MNQQKSFLLALCIVLAMPAASALAQIGRGAGGIGGRGAIGGVRPGLSSPRSGLGVRSNPIVNPAPSLTPHEVLNPRGSLSSGQVLNPAPSVLRPRSGGTTPTARQSVTTGGRDIAGSTYRRTRPISGGSTADYFDQLGDQLREHKNGESWAQYLALPKDGSGEATKEKLLRRFERLSSNPAYAKVTALPAFAEAHEALKRDGSGKAHGGSDLDPTQRTGGEWILQSAVALDHELEQRSLDGAWSKRLSLDELRIAIPVLSEHPANDSQRKALEKIVSTFQDVAKDNNAANVHQLPDFKETLLALRAYLNASEPDPPELSSSFDQLDDQLRDYSNGDSWATYLALPKELSDGGPTQAAREPTQKLLKRFDKLTSDPTYQPVTALVAFRPAYEALKLAADKADALPPPTTVASADKPAVTPTVAKPAAAEKPQPAADKKPVAAADEKPAAVADKKAVAAVDMKPAEPRPSDPETTKPIEPPPGQQSVGERVLKAAVALEQKLAKVAPENAWPKRLSLAQLEVTVSMTSDQPRSDSDRKSLEEIVKTFQEVAKSKDDAAVTQLPEFKETLEALQQYLKPADAPPSKD